MCHVISDTSIQSCQCRAKSGTGSKSTESCGSNLNKTEWVVSWIWPTGHTLPTPAIGNEVMSKRHIHKAKENG